MATDMRIVGYLPEYRAGHLAQLPSELLTDLIVFSIAPIPEGDIQAGDRLLTMLPKLPRGGDLRLHICIGGWAKSANFATVTADSAKRAHLVAALLGFCETHTLHGVDVDWEFPRGPEQIANFATLLRELRMALHSSSRELTVALAHRQTFSPEIYALADYWRLMSYDNDGQHSATPPPWTTSTVRSSLAHRVSGCASDFPSMGAA